MALIPYNWNLPKNVSRDAKYAVRRKKGKMEIGLLFRTNYGEQWSLSTNEHPQLVHMVNSVKMEATGNQAGSFNINEYQQVIVPAADDSDTYYYAGEYHPDLEFLFEGKVISGRAVGLNGKPLKPGDTWEGVHPGIPYVLKAGGKDISFKHPLRPNVTREELLSKYTSPTEALEFALRIRSIKGFEGGRFYVNERRHIFAPLGSEGGLNYVYIGDLAPNDPWFPKWHPSSGG
jgi:hypothetical protein